MTKCEQLLRTFGSSRVLLDGLRHYKIEGVSDPLPSVTTVLSVINKPFLFTWQRNEQKAALLKSLKNKPTQLSKMEELYWIEKVVNEGLGAADKIRDAAGDFGTKAHELIEGVIQGDTSPIPEKQDAVIKAFHAWREQTNITLTSQEAVVYSPKFKYAGALDAIGRTKSGDLVVIDWKTSNSLKTDYAFQLAAYAKAVEELSGEKVSEAWVIRFDKKSPKFEARQIRNLDVSFESFLAALTLFRRLKESHWTDR